MVDDEEDVEPKLRRGRFRSLLSSTSSLSVSSISTSVSFVSPRRDDAEAAAERAAVRRLDERGWDSVVGASVTAGIAEVVLDRRRLILVTPPVSDIVGGKDGADADDDDDDEAATTAPIPMDAVAMEPAVTPPTQLSSSLAGGTFSFPLHSFGSGVDEQEPHGDDVGLEDGRAVVWVGMRT